jgi:hypothetical protein
MPLFSERFITPSKPISSPISPFVGIDSNTTTLKLAFVSAQHVIDG